MNVFRFFWLGATRTDYATVWICNPPEHVRSEGSFQWGIAFQPMRAGTLIAMELEYCGRLSTVPYHILPLHSGSVPLLNSSRRLTLVSRVL